MNSVIKIRNIILLLTLLLAAGTLSACRLGQSQPEPVTDSLFAMDTYMTFTAYGENAGDAIEKAKEKVLSLDEMLSVNNEESEVYELNHEGQPVLSDETLYLLDRSIEAYEISHGAFNPLVYPLMLAWGFTTEEYRIPSDDELEYLAALLDLEYVYRDEDLKSVSFGKEGMMIDFGGIAKGYASSCLMDIFRECGVKSACVSLGGNVHVLGTKPDGSKWNVAVRDPEDPSEYMGILSISDSAVITSGAYERYFEEDGVIYHHILDPDSGCPADSGIISSTIVSNNGTLADALSTAVYVMGLEKAEQLWRENPGLFDMIIMTSDNQVYITEGLKKDFKSDRYKTSIITP